MGGRKHHLALASVANPTWTCQAGCAAPVFRRQPDRLNPLEMLKDHEPLPAYYMDPAERVKMIEQQGLQGSGCSRRWACCTRKSSDDVGGVTMMGVQPLAARRLVPIRETIFSAPALGSVGAAVAEVDGACLGAQVLVMRRPVTTRSAVSFRPVRSVLGPSMKLGSRWIHAADSGYRRRGMPMTGSRRWVWAVRARAEGICDERRRTS